MMRTFALTCAAFSCWFSLGTCLATPALLPTSLTSLTSFNSTALHGNLTLPNPFYWRRPHYPYLVTYLGFRQPNFTIPAGKSFIASALHDLDSLRQEQYAEWADALPTGGYIYANGSFGGAAGMQFTIIHAFDPDLPESLLSYEAVETVMLGFLRVFRHPVHERVFTAAFSLEFWLERKRAWKRLGSGSLSPAGPIGGRGGAVSL